MKDSPRQSCLIWKRREPPMLERPAEIRAETWSKANTDGVGGNKSAPGEEGSPGSGLGGMVASPSLGAIHCQTWLGCEGVGERRGTETPRPPFSPKPFCNFTNLWAARIYPKGWGWMRAKMKCKQQNFSPKIIMEMSCGNKVIVLVDWLEHQYKPIILSERTNTSCRVNRALLGCS